MSHPVAVMQTAKRLHAGGWNAPEIVAVLEREHGVKVHPNTVSIWCSQRRYKQHRRNDVAQKANARAAQSAGRLRTNVKRPEFIEQRIVALRTELGLNKRQIAALIEFDLGVQFTTNKITRILKEHEQCRA